LSTNTLKISASQAPISNFPFKDTKPSQAITRKGRLPVAARLNLDTVQFKVSKVQIDPDGKDRILPIDTGSKEKEQPPPSDSEKT
jgi:hypothetical protein